VIKENDKRLVVRTGSSQTGTLGSGQIDHSRASKKESLKHLACSRHARKMNHVMCGMRWAEFGGYHFF
jgi:hypothetical protein